MGKVYWVKSWVEVGWKLGGSWVKKDTDNDRSTTAYQNQRYSNNFSEKNLRRMIQFASVFSDEQIVVSPIRQLSWTHFVALIPLKSDLQREFYLELCKAEAWNVKTLREKINSMLYERTAISKRPDELKLLQLDRVGIKVSEYLTQLPSKKLLKEKLHQAIEVSKKHIENKLKQEDKS